VKCQKKVEILSAFAHRGIKNGDFGLRTGIGPHQALNFLTTCSTVNYNLKISIIVRFFNNANLLFLGSFCNLKLTANLYFCGTILEYVYNAIHRSVLVVCDFDILLLDCLKVGLLDNILPNNSTGSVIDMILHAID